MSQVLECILCICCAGTQYTLYIITASTQHMSSVYTVVTLDVFLCLAHNPLWKWQVMESNTPPLLGVVTGSGKYTDSAW